MDDMAEDDRRAPYVTYGNLVDFIDETLVRAALPERIDRAFLTEQSMSPHLQLLLLQALRVIGLIDAERRPTEALRYAVQDAESRREVLRGWAKDFYPDQLALAERDATAASMQASFARFGYQGSTLRKAMSFFVAVSADADLPTSRYFAASRQFPQPSTRRPLRSGRDRPFIEFLPRIDQPGIDQYRTDQHRTDQQSGGERRTIAFGSAGQVVLDVQLRWLDLPIETMTRLRQLVQELEDLAADVEPGS